MKESNETESIKWLYFRHLSQFGIRKKILINSKDKIFDFETLKSMCYHNQETEEDGICKNEY